MRIHVTSPQGRDYKATAKETPKLKKEVEKEKAKAEAVPQDVEKILKENTIQELETVEDNYSKGKKKEVVNGKEKDLDEKGQKTKKQKKVPKKSKSYRKTNRTDNKNI